MSKIRIILLGFYLFIVFCPALKAQVEYKTGIGIRAGWPTALSVKHLFGDTWALEGLITGRYRGMGIIALLEKHKTAFNSQGFFWFYGGGAHLSFFNGDYYRGPHKDLYKRDAFSYGVDGIVGLEYFISEIPFTVGVDFKPAVEINYGPYFDLGGALTVRYVF